MPNIFLTESWQQRHTNDVRSRAGNRYSPQFHVDLPIARLFSGLSRDVEFYREIRERFGALARKTARLSWCENIPEFSKSVGSLRKQANSLLNVLNAIKEFSNDLIDWTEIGQYSKLSIQATRAVLELSWTLELEQKSKPNLERNGTDFNRLRHELYEGEKELRFLAKESETSWAKASNIRALLLTGSAGTGKTHLLCDVVEARSKRRKPSLLVFGESFTEGMPLLEQIASQLHFGEYGLSGANIPSLLDEAGSEAGERSLLMIDALNETPSLSYWKRELPQLMEILVDYPHTALVVSVRDGFEAEVIPASCMHSFVKESHPGFEFREWEAASKFFGEFGIPVPDIPLLMPEFRTPLFLLLFCKGIQSRIRKNIKSGKRKQVFRGHEGATYIFENFIKASADRVAKEFGLKPGRDHQGRYVIWDTVIEPMAARISSNRLHLDRIQGKTLRAIIAQAHPSVDADELALALERNYLVTKIPNYRRGIRNGYAFRFPYQKFSDHLIVRYLLKNTSLKRAGLLRKFRKAEKFGKIISMPWRYRGLIEALAVQIPERFDGTELPDLVPWARTDQTVRDALPQSRSFR